MTEPIEPNWRVAEVSSPGVIWARYAKAVGILELQNVFGGHWPPEGARPLEHVFVWRDSNLSPRPFDASDHPACWLSLSYDQFDPAEAHMSRGVWPDQHGKNLGRLMRAFAEDWCRQNKVEVLSIEVAAANPKHLANVLNDPYWDFTGIPVLNPPIFGFSHEIE